MLVIPDLWIVGPWAVWPPAWWTWLTNWWRQHARKS